MGIVSNTFPMTTISYPSILWQQLHGKKFLYPLHPDMLTDSGYLRELEIRPVPYSQFPQKDWFNVKFDRDYAVRKLAHEIQNCGDVPFVELVEVLSEAYAIVNPDAPIVGVMAQIRSATTPMLGIDVAVL